MVSLGRIKSNEFSASRMCDDLFWIGRGEDTVYHSTVTATANGTKMVPVTGLRVNSGFKQECIPVGCVPAAH